MEIEGEILGFVIIFLVICAGFYFFIVRDEGDSQENAANLPDQGNSANAGADQGNQQGQADDDSTNANSTVNNQTNDTDSNIDFEDIEELHWNHMPLTYKIINNGSECEGVSIVKLKEAFEVIAVASNHKVNFTEAGENQSADINISCVDRAELLDELEGNETCKDVVLDYRSVQFSGYEVLTDDDYVVSLNIISRNDSSNTYTLCYVNKNSVSVSFDWNLLGEARIEKDGEIIKSARKTIYTVDSEYPYCTDFPAKEVHDIMHLLGFAHIETPVFDDYYGWFFKDFRYFKDVMFPYPYCAYITELNDNYANCLEYIYSNGQSGSGCAAVNFED
jgi:hypothetical protein